MNTLSFAGFVALSAWFSSAPLASAHRLDEYLQASRLSVGTDRVDLETDLTPGAAIADEMLAWIDRNGDGRISDDEADAYAKEMLRAVPLKVDGLPTPVGLVRSSFPEWSDVRLGVGVIRLRATASIPAAGAGAGQHVISFLNTHKPESSVYLVNALISDDPRIQLGRPLRDYLQHGMTLDYAVAAEVSSVARTWGLLAGLVIAGFLFLRLAFGLTRAAAQPNPLNNVLAALFFEKPTGQKFPSPCREA